MAGDVQTAGDPARDEAIDEALDEMGGCFEEILRRALPDQLDGRRTFPGHLEKTRNKLCFVELEYGLTTSVSIAFAPLAFRCSHVRKAYTFIVWWSPFWC